jgi:hypothetical protein
MTGTYKDAPEDIKAKAKNLVETYGFDPAILEGAIAAALDNEREITAQQARDAAALASHPSGLTTLRKKAQHLVDCLDDADRNHGGLVGGVTMRVANELRQELMKWNAR